MMYNNKLVTCIKVNGKILREFKDTVYVPFGSEYSVFVKNLESRRAIVKIEIDGTQVCPDGFVVNANSDLDVERFVKDMNKGNRFKFIERTAKIEDGPRGIKAEDGLIRVSFQYEKVLPKTTIVTDHVYHNTVHHYPYRWPHHDGWYGSMPPVVYTKGILGGNALSDSAGSMIGAVNCSTTATTLTTAGAGVDVKMAATNTVSPQSVFSAQGMAQNMSSVRSFADAGITVPGSVSNQSFKYVASFPTEAEEHVMVIRLLGEDPKGEVIKVPVTVKAKPKCVTCGRNNKAHSKFCVECGTALEII